MNKIILRNEVSKGIRGGVIIKKITSLFLVLVALLMFGNVPNVYADTFDSVSSYTDDSGNIFYYKGNTLYKCINNTKDVIIPDKINDVSITRITPFHCHYVNFFDNYTDVESVTLPKDLDYIDDYVFNKCDSIKSVSIDSSNDEFSIIDGNLYGSSYNNPIFYMMYYCGGKTESAFTIPEGVSVISSYCFQFSNLKSIVIPESVKYIDIANFYEGTLDDYKYTSNLENVHFVGNNMDRIGIEVKFYNNVFTRANITFDSVSYFPKVNVSNSGMYYVVYKDEKNVIKLCTFNLNSKCKKEDRYIYSNGRNKYVEDITYYTLSNNKWVKDKKQEKKLYLDITSLFVFSILQSNIKVYDAIFYNTVCDPLFKHTEESNVLVSNGTVKPNKTSNKLFKLGRDNNVFYNSTSKNAKSGFNGVKKYTVSSKMYKTLIDAKVNTEIKYLQKMLNKGLTDSSFAICSGMGILHDGFRKSQEISSSKNKTFTKLNLPYKDSKFLDSLKLYSIAQFLGMNYEEGAELASCYSNKVFDNSSGSLNRWVYNDNEKEFLKTVVNKTFEHALDYNTYILTYQLKNGKGHSVLVTDMNYDAIKDLYTFTLFDCNSVDSKHPNGYFGYLKIKGDYSYFTYNCKGIKFDSKDYLTMKLYSSDLVDTVTGLPCFHPVVNNSIKMGRTTIRIPINNNIKIVNENGKYFQIKDGKISTDNTIYYIDSYNFDNKCMLSVNLEGSIFSISELGNTCDITITNEDNLLSLEGRNITSASINISNKKLNCTGSGNYSFGIMSSTDNNIAQIIGEKGLVEVKGKATGSINSFIKYNKLNVVADSLTNVVGYNYIDDVVYRENLTNGKTVKKVEGTSMIPIDMVFCSYSKVKDCTYNGKVKKPNVVVKYCNKKLVKNKDYTISYSKNKNSGNAKITIRGIKNYTGIKNINFRIKKAKSYLKFNKSYVSIKKKRKTYVNKLKKRTDCKIVYYSGNKRIATVNKKGKVRFKRKGTVRIYAKAVKGKNYSNRIISYKLRIR